MTVAHVINKVFIRPFALSLPSKYNEQAAKEYVKNGSYSTQVKDGKTIADYKLPKENKGLIYNKANKKIIAEGVLNELNKRAPTNRTVDDIGAEIFAHQLGADLLKAFKWMPIVSDWYESMSETNVNEDEYRINRFKTIEIIFGW